MQTALISLMGHSDLIAQCDHVVSQVRLRHGLESLPEDPETWVHYFESLVNVW